MSLNAHDRRALALIEEQLAGNDPRFAARLSAFSRLADGAMPERERIRGDRSPAVGSVIGTVRTGRTGRTGRLAAPRLMHWLAVAMAISVSLAVIGFALLGGHTSSKLRPGGGTVRRTSLWNPGPPGQKSGRPASGSTAPSLLP